MGNYARRMYIYTSSKPQVLPTGGGESSARSLRMADGSARVSGSRILSSFRSCRKSEPDTAGFPSLPSRETPLAFREQRDRLPAVSAPEVDRYLLPERVPRSGIHSRPRCDTRSVPPELRACV